MISLNKATVISLAILDAFAQFPSKLSTPLCFSGVLYLLLRRNKYGEYGERLTEKKAAVNV